MDNLNRVLIKSQAKEMIREKIFILFVITFVAVFLSNGMSLSYSTGNNIDKIINGNSSSSENTLDDYNNYYDYFNQDQSGNGSSSSDNPIENFGKSTPQSYEPETASIIDSGLSQLQQSVSSLSVVISAIFAPLLVTLCGFYVRFIRKRPDEPLALGAELKGLFVDSFNGTFLRKLLVYFLRSLFTTLLSVLFLIPGIMYYYSTYFAFELMCEYPNLKPMEALRLSKKMVKGNRGELFRLDFSFIGWMLLVVITCGIASIYVLPYMFTTHALYYENFRLRALALGRINADDFLSENERRFKYASGGEQGYYSPNFNGQYTENQPNTAGEYYHPNNYAQPGNSNNNYYYQPDDNTNDNSNYYQPGNDSNNGNDSYYQPSDNNSYYQPTPPAAEAPKATTAQPENPPEQDNSTQQ